MVAQGWGAYSQTRAIARQSSTLRLAHGQLTLNTLRLAAPGSVAGVRVTVDEQPIATTLSEADGAARLTFAAPLTLTEGQTLLVEIQEQL